LEAFSPLFQQDNWCGHYFGSLFIAQQVSVLPVYITQPIILNNILLSLDFSTLDVIGFLLCYIWI
jgi:hypothetical protein